MANLMTRMLLTWRGLLALLEHIGGAGIVQWWDGSAPTNVSGVRSRPGTISLRVKFVVGSRLTPRVFLRVLWFSSLHKNKHFYWNFNSTKIEDPHKNQTEDWCGFLSYIIYATLSAEELGTMSKMNLRDITLGMGIRSMWRICSLTLKISCPCNSSTGICAHEEASLQRTLFVL